MLDDHQTKNIPSISDAPKSGAAGDQPPAYSNLTRPHPACKEGVQVRLPQGFFCSGHCSPSASAVAGGL